MSLDKLLAAIETDAADEAASILNRARDEAERLLAQADLRAQTRASALRDSLLERCRKETAQQVSQARLEARNQVLEVQQELVDAVFQEARNTLRKMDDDAYRQFMQRQIVRVYTSPEETVIVSVNDRHRLTQAWIEETNRALVRSGKTGPLRVEFSDDDFGGGFLVRHRGYEVNATFDELVESIRAGMRARIAAIMFED